ncbi:glycosyl hydrolase family 71-domain-containing protein [Podospora didyma]|uniref:Glycosyl hydrolase family 71-domain-containing protein n=1 Tax=Podospora didyma TaxID=330526 RepID=A0AAE0NYM6_9PEZI|nr:glycosyl hydrolase family 71-domain-containing protein [Podospora didyma]
MKLTAPFLTLGLSVLYGAVQVQASAVFAHFMVGNVQSFDLSLWRKDISLAQEAKIDAFALNIAYNDKSIYDSLKIAFEAARLQNFKLFFSFDYAGGGPWPKGDVLDLASLYFGRKEYFTYNGKPLASTFEGADKSDDWVDIKNQTKCFFLPDWSSRGAGPASELSNGVADGLFAWAAWPWGSRDMDTYTDAYYNETLTKVNKPYMMAVSPWFYTSLPGWNKNWLWRGDSLWHDRWVEIIDQQPEFVEIVSWNDYGESHHIGPLYDHAMGLFESGKAPFNYAQDMPHDGWRQLLPFLIDSYKNKRPTITNEGLVSWYRTSPAGACGDGKTSGNTASQMQLEFPPAEVSRDRIFFSALLGSPASVTVTIGKHTRSADWKSIPDGGIGIYHGSIPFCGSSGGVTIRLSRNAKTITQISGHSISLANCQKGLTNWNAWVGSNTATTTISATPALSRSQQVCIEGTGANDKFADLCAFSCRFGYCPLSACVCKALGAPRTPPPAKYPTGYPAKGLSAAYTGLCKYSCERGHCPADICSPTKQELVVPTVSEFSPPACIAGTGKSKKLAGLCEWACAYGFCPIGACKCTKQGALPAGLTWENVGDVKAVEGVEDFGLCDYACHRGNCPRDVCAKVVT